MSEPNFQNVPLPGWMRRDVPRGFVPRLRLPITIDYAATEERILQFYTQQR